MNDRIQKEAKQELAETSVKKINRKEAIKKTAFIAVSAATMMMLLSSPSKAQTTSPAAPPPW